MSARPASTESLIKTRKYIIIKLSTWNYEIFLDCNIERIALSERARVLADNKSVAGGVW